MQVALYGDTLAFYFIEGIDFTQEIGFVEYTCAIGLCDISHCRFLLQVYTNELFESRFQCRIFAVQFFQRRFPIDTLIFEAGVGILDLSFGSFYLSTAFPQWERDTNDDTVEFLSGSDFMVITHRNTGKGSGSAYFQVGLGPFLLAE